MQKITVRYRIFVSFHPFRHSVNIETGNGMFNPGLFFDKEMKHRLMQKDKHIHQ